MSTLIASRPSRFEAEGTSSSSPFTFYPLMADFYTKAKDLRADLVTQNLAQALRIYLETNGEDAGRDLIAFNLP